MWIVHNFQVSPVRNHQRFDALILSAVVQALEQAGHLVVVKDIYLPGNQAVGTISFKGATFSGLIGDFLVVEEGESGKFWVVDYQDMNTGPAACLATAPGFAGAFISMFLRSAMRDIFHPDAYECVAPGWFTDIYPETTEESLPVVQDIRTRKLDRRLFFAGKINDYSSGEDNIRQAAVVLQEKYPDEVRVETTKLDRVQWFMAAAQHAVCLTLPGGGPWCSREFELFHLGIPVLTYEWTSELQHRWVPNLHYTAVEGMARHRSGFPLDSEQAADQLIARHRQVMQQLEVVEVRARHARVHYECFFRPSKIGQQAASLILRARG